jgi:LPXTG-site transpeptidase (sortase) family protein
MMNCAPNRRSRRDWTDVTHTSCATIVEPPRPSPGKSIPSHVPWTHANAVATGTEYPLRSSGHNLTLRRVAIVAVLLLLPVIVLTASGLDLSSSHQPGVIRGPSERDPQTLGSAPFIAPTATATLPPGHTPTVTPAATARPTRTSNGLVPSPTPAPTQTPTPTPIPPTPTPEPPANRFVIPSVGIRAVVETQGLDANMVMQVPADPFQVAWYDFTAKPGTPGNAVFAGHVDHIRVGRAVFWNLRNVKIGDGIEYQSIDGQIFRYRVTRITTQSASAPANDIVAPTTVETMTVITCTGSFDRNSRSYDQRLIVQATRELP